MLNVPPVYIFGGIPPYIYADIGGADRWIWFVRAEDVLKYVSISDCLTGPRKPSIPGSGLPFCRIHFRLVRQTIRRSCWCWSHRHRNDNMFYCS